VDETGTADEMEQVRAPRDPEFHSGLCSGGYVNPPMPSGFVIGQVGREDLSLLGQNCVVRLLAELALVGPRPRRFGEEKPVVRGHDDVVSVEVVHDVPNESGDFIDGQPPKLLHNPVGVVGLSMLRRT
jgi:hypothetical protein